MLTVTTRSTKTHFFNRYSEFQNSYPASNFDIPIIRNASPYVSEEEMIRKENMKSKEMWVTDKDFLRNFGKATINNEHNFIPNYVSMDPSPPPILHKFR